MTESNMINTFRTLEDDDRMAGKWISREALANSILNGVCDWV